MKYDKPLLAMLIGILQFIPIEIYTQIMKIFNLTTVSTFEAISMMWIREGSWVLGNLAVIGIGSWLGLSTYHSIKIFGSDYFLIKAVLVSMTFQSLLFNIFGILGGNFNSTQNLSGNLVHTSAAAIGGVIAGFLIEKFLLKDKNLEL